MENTLLKKIALANEQIKKVCEFLDEHKEALDCMDFRMTEAHKYYTNNLEQLKNTYRYLNMENNWFKSYCEKMYNNLSLQLSYRHSDIELMIDLKDSFYLHDREIIDITEHTIDYGSTIYNFMYCYDDCNIEDTMYITDKELHFDFFLSETEGKYIVENLNYIIDYLYLAVKDYCKDIIEAYEFIQEYKNNQIENLIEYLDIENRTQSLLNNSN